MVEIVDLVLRAVIDFLVYTINSLITKKETYFIMFKASFGITQPK